MKYSEGFRASIVKKTQDGSGRSVYQVAKETGISASTILNWITQFKNGRLGLDGSDSITPSQRSPSEKLALLLEGQTIAEDAKGEWLRKHGLKRKGSPRFVLHRLTIEEENAFYNVANSERFRDATPEEIIAILAGEGIFHASSSTLYRILRKRKALQHRQETKKPVRNTKAIPTLVTGPNQVWAWDNTWLKTDVVGLFKYGYNIIDLYDRTIVGWSVEDAESDGHARKLFERVK